MLEVSLLGVGTVPRLERDAWSMVTLLWQATNRYAPPPPLPMPIPPPMPRPTPTVQPLHASPGDEAGLRSVLVFVDGESAYGWLRREAGVHRLVRNSPYDPTGRRHTSFSQVRIFPEAGSGSGESYSEAKNRRVNPYSSCMPEVVYRSRRSWAGFFLPGLAEVFLGRCSFAAALGV